jgi:hypothetical protein
MKQMVGFALWKELLPSRMNSQCPFLLMGDEERFQLAHLAFFGFLSIFFVSFCVPHLKAMVTRLVHLATHTLSSYTFFFFLFAHLLLVGYKEFAQ